jgi:hypothetical protein
MPSTASAAGVIEELALLLLYGETSFFLISGWSPGKLAE